MLKLPAHYFFPHHCKCQMPSRLKQKQSENPNSGKKLKRLWPAVKYTGFLAGFVILVAAVYQLVFMVCLTAGISKEKPAPGQIVTVEIINASGISQMSKQVRAKLSEVKDKDIIVRVVQAERLDYKEIEKSLVISRNKNTELAKFIAGAVGISKSEVVYRPALENDMSPIVTLVLGEDIQELLNPDKNIQGEITK